MKQQEDITGIDQQLANFQKENKILQDQLNKFEK